MQRNEIDITQQMLRFSSTRILLLGALKGTACRSQRCQESTASKHSLHVYFIPTLYLHKTSQTDGC